MMFGILDNLFLKELWIGLILTWAIVNVFWAISMQRALDLVYPNTKMKGQNVWLTFIPLFGMVWQFIVVSAVADGLGQEYQRRGIISREPKPGFQSGLTASILFCCCLLPTLGMLLAYFSNITRIIHLVKIKNYCKELEGIMKVQSEYPVVPISPSNWEEKVEPSLEENLIQNAPTRFMPPVSKEEDLERWKKK